MANNTTPDYNASIYDTLVERSFATLMRTKPSSFGFIATGLLAVVSNILVVVLIRKTESLRTPSHFLIAQLALADWLVGVSYVITGIKRLIRVYLLIPEVATQLHCCGEMFALYFSQAASLTLALSIAIERVFATTTPIFYMTHSNRIVQILGIFGWSYAIVDGSFMFYGVSSTKLISNCFLTSSVTQSFYNFGAIHKPILVCVMMSLYGVVMLSVHLHVRNARKRNENVSSVKKKVQAKVAKMLCVMTSLYLVTQIITRCGMAILGLFPPHIRPRYGQYIRMLMILNNGINLFVYVGLSSEYKNAFRALIGKPTITGGTVASKRSGFTASKVRDTKQISVGVSPGINSGAETRKEAWQVERNV